MTTTAPDRKLTLQADAPGDLVLADLLNDVSTLRELLLASIGRGAWLDAYLLAAGVNQVVEDYLNPDPLLLRRIARQVNRWSSPLAAPAAAAARLVATELVALRALRSRVRTVADWQAGFADVVQDLADAVVRAASPSPASMQDAHRLLGAIEPLFPADLRRSLIRLPSCFRSFDQRPADLERIIRDFAARWPNRQRALLVVGVRTSGSYLAPLYAATLRSAGYEDVQVITLRPGHPLRAPERAAVQALVARSGLVLLTDDPPVSGASVGAAAADLLQAGASASQIVLLLQVFGSAQGLPDRLRQFPSVLLPWEAWDVHARLEPAAVAAGLVALLGPDYRRATVERVEPLFSPSDRGHARAHYRVRGPAGEQYVYLRGTGLGYLGRSALGIARAASEHLPAIYGVRDGLLYREWLPEACRLDSSMSSSVEVNRLPSAAVAYTLGRSRHLATPDDRSVSLRGEWAAWEVASTVLSRVCGRAALPTRLLLLERVVKRLLRVQRPCVVDGRMAADQWFAEPGSGQSLRKVGFEDGVFRNDVELTSYDPAFDLANVAPGARSSALPDRVRRLYECQTGEHITEERWLLLQLAHLWKEARNPARSQEASRASARAMQRYFATVLLQDVPRASPAGAVCALDLDGVLETTHLGFSSTTPAGALALRGLLSHGYQVILATGRSADEVRERCEAYGLSGGVAEYGAVVYNHVLGRARFLLSPPEYDDLARLRACLEGSAALFLDTDYQHSVRAYRLDTRGRRFALEAAVVDAALLESGTLGRMRVIQGEGQTDFTVSRLDKRVGVLELIHQLGVPGESTGCLALAVGDTAADLSMLRLATVGRAPAQAHPSLGRAGVVRAKCPYQAGLGLAVADLLGHAPGDCHVCRAPAVSEETRLLMALLSLGEAGRWRSPSRALRLALRLWFGGGRPWPV